MRHRCGLDCLREDGEFSSDRAAGRRGTAGLGCDLDQLQPRASPLNTGVLFWLPCTSQENWEWEGHRPRKDRRAAMCGIIYTPARTHCRKLPRKCIPYSKGGCLLCTWKRTNSPRVGAQTVLLFHTNLEVLKVVPRPRPDVKGPSWVGHFLASGPRVASVRLTGRHLRGGGGGCMGGARCGLTLGPGCDPHP